MFVCISTKDRSHFYDWAYEMVQRQRLPPCKVIIVDGSITPSAWSAWPNATYIHCPNIVLGASRNLAIAVAAQNSAEYISLWDDDDYYEDWHLERAKSLLDANPTAQAVGSTLTPIYFPHYDELWTSGPFDENHAIEPSLVFRASLAESCKFDDADPAGLGSVFLKDFTMPMLQMPWSHVMVSHSKNTVSKEGVRLGKHLGKRSDRQLPSALRNHPCVA
jgi:hypothetical protein